MCTYQAHIPSHLMLMVLTIITLAMPGHHKRRTQQTRKNPTGSHLLLLGRERQLLIKCLMHWVDSNHRPSDYEARVRSTTPQCSHKSIVKPSLQATLFPAEKYQKFLMSAIRNGRTNICLTLAPKIRCIKGKPDPSGAGIKSSFGCRS